MFTLSNRRAGLASKVKTLADGGRLPGSPSASSGWRFFIAAYFLILSASLNAQIYRSLNFEDVRISDYLEGKPDNGFWRLTDAGTDYKVATKWSVSTGIVRTPEVTGKFSREGKQSLKITIEPNTSRKTPGEKCLIDVCSGDLDKFATRNETRAVAFSIFIPDEYELQDKPLMLSEWWNGNPWVMLSITPGSLKLQLLIKNKEKHKTIALNQLERNRWHDIILEVTPNATANGSVRYWCDGELVKSVDDMPIGDGARRKYFIEVGLYRPACPQRAVVYFDSIHLGRTGAELKKVAPSPLKKTQVATPRLEKTEAVAASVAAVPSARKPNILFIAVDDLNSWVLRPDKPARTPNLDKLLSQSTVFTHAQCASPSCHPSRVAVMTGRSPLETGIVRNLKLTSTRNPSWRQAPTLARAVTLPEYLRQAGYGVKGSGKVFHATQYESEHENDPAVWDEYFPEKNRPMPFQPVPPLDYFAKNKAAGRPAGHFDWTPLHVEDRDMSDYQVVDWALSELRKPQDKPVFLAVGLFRPHVPFHVPEKYYKEYPLESIRVPAGYPPHLTPPRAVVTDGVVSKFGRDLYQWSVANGQVEEAIQGYLASVSFFDAMLGRLLRGLDESPSGDSTIIVLWSDNGYHLAEKERFEKFTLWREATNVPLVIRLPKGRGQPGICNRPVSLLSLYPTIADLIEGPPPPSELDAESLRPWLQNPDAEKSTPVIVAGSDPGSFAVVTQDFRYIRYADGSEELYNLKADPDELRDVSGLPKYATAQTALKGLLPAKFNEFMPTGGRPN